MLRRPSIACLVVTATLTRVAFGEGGSVDIATAGDKKAAGELFTGAMEQFDKDDLESALKGFRESYSRVRSPNSHFMIARTLARMGRNTEAYEELDAVIAEADALGERYSETANAARTKREEVRPRVALVTVSLGTVPKGTRVLLGEEPLDPKRLGKPIPVLPGETTVTTVTPDGKRFPQTVKVEAGGAAPVVANVPPEKPVPKAFVDRPEHPPYGLEAEFSAIGETLEPAERATRGAGIGARAELELLHRGLIPDVNDGVAVGTGIDWIATSTDPHFWIPVTVQWNFWVLPEFSLMVEPGVALLLGTGTAVRPALSVGGRYRVWKKLHLVGKVGIPAATLGVSWLF